MSPFSSIDSALSEEIQKIDETFKRNIEQAQKGFYTTLTPKRNSNKILIGISALNGRPVFLAEEDRKYHMHIIGSTGAGKSKLLEYMIRCDIDQGRGLCLIDPHGDLYHNILKYVVRKRLGEKVILIDPNDEEWAVGINYLEYDSQRSSTSHASEVMKGIAKVFGGENTDILPRLQRWERNTLIALIESGLTLVEMPDFVNPEFPDLRSQVIKKVKTVQVVQEWRLFEEIPEREKVNYVEAVLNRANKFAVGENIRRIFGQVQSTINFREAMDKGKVILCNLASNKLSEEEQKMLGVVIIDKIVQAGKSRVDIPEEKRRPFYFYLDEFGQFVSEDIAKALWELRKFRVHLILAHQELKQLEEESQRVYSAVMNEPQVRVSFRVGREDAEIMAKEMFTGKIRGDKEKRRIEQTKFWPVETTREIVTDSETWMEGESESSGWTESEGGTESEGESYRTSILMPVFLGPDNITYTEVSTESASSARSSAQARSSSYGGGISYSTVPWYEYRPFKEVSNIEDYSIEEIVEKYIAWIKNQPDRHAQVQIKQKSPIPITTPFVKPLPVREKDIQALKEKVYRKYALPAQEVDKQIEERRKKLLEILVEPLRFREPKKKGRKPKAEKMAIEAKTPLEVSEPVTSRELQQETKVPKS